MDLDSRPIVFGVIRQFRHIPRFGSWGVSADIYADRECTVLLASGRNLRMRETVRADFSQPLVDKAKHGLEYRLVWL